MAEPPDPSLTERELKLLALKQERLKEINRDYEEQKGIVDQLIELENQGGDKLRTRVETTLQLLEQQDKLHQLKRDELKTQLSILEAQKQENSEQAIAIKKKLEELEVEKNIRNEKKFLASEADKVAKSNASSFSSMTGIGAPAKTLLGSMVQLAGKGVSLKDSLYASGQEIGKMLTPANLLALAIDKVLMATIDMAKEQDKAFADFEKEAGNVHQYEQQIMSLRNANGLYGVSVTDAANAFKQFKTQFAGFEGMSKNQQSALAETAARLGKLGIAETDVVKTQELLVKGMGMTVQQSTDLQKSLYGTAQAMGLPPKQVAADFAKAAPQLAAHGKNMTKVFLDLQNNAKNTGIAFDRLLAITGKFDTFEGAADSAGQLNAILGGDYLNSIELLNATEGERVKILQESLKASGRSIDSMSKQEQMATAQALGLSDVTELQKLMNNETTKGTVEAMRAEEAQKKMNQAIEEAQELGQMWNNLMAKLAINLRPVIELLKSATAGLLEFFDGIGNGWDKFKEFIGGFETLGKLWSGIKEMFSGINNFFGGWPSKIGAVILAIGGFILVWKGIKFAVSALIKGVAKTFAESLDTLSGPVSEGAKKMGKGIGEGVDSASKGISKGISRLGSTFMKNAAGIAIGVLALIGIAGALYLFGVAIKEFTLERVLAAAIGLAAMVAAVAGLGALMSSGIGGLAVLAGVAAILAIGAAVMLLGYGIKALGDGLVNINVGFKGLLETLKNISSIKDNMGIMLKFVEDLADIDVDPINKLANAMKSLAESMKNIGDASVKVSGTTQVTQAASTAVTPKVSTTTAAAAATVNNTAPPATNNTGNTNIVPVAVYLDSKKVGEILDPRIKQTIQDSLKSIGSKTAAVGI